MFPKTCDSIVKSPMFCKQKSHLVSFFPVPINFFYGFSAISAPPSQGPPLERNSESLVDHPSEQWNTWDHPWNTWHSNTWMCFNCWKTSLIHRACEIDQVRKWKNCIKISVFLASGTTSCDKIASLAKSTGTDLRTIIIAWGLNVGMRIAQQDFNDLPRHKSNGFFAKDGTKTGPKPMGFSINAHHFGGSPRRNRNGSLN